MSKEKRARRARDEKNRKLSPAEERRLAHFNEVCEELRAAGYEQHDLTISIVAANLAVLIAAIPVFVIGFFAYYKVNGSILSEGPAHLPVLLFLVIYLVLIVVHELVHGITWSIFSEHHLKDIEFGIMKEYATPYCTCAAPLSRGAYLAGGLMPLIVLGIIPAIIAIAAGSVFWLLIGLIMILSAGGDVMIAIKMIRYRSAAKDVLYYDHPTQGGLVVFEKM
ncbi:MAG: DUF3267 domain-containing protein [Mogibacterium sp.]|nr:DUF3267 domain-containing protein [Mogibacterium sp.]